MGTDTTYAVLRDTAAQLADDIAVYGCHRFEFGQSPGADGKRPTKRCNRRFECASCAARAMRVRRDQLMTTLVVARILGIEVLFVTLTVSHGRSDAFVQTLGVLRGAYKYLLTDGRRGQSLKKELAVWLIDRTLETTDSADGFHPHFHLLFFRSPTAPKADLDQVTRRLTAAWKEALTAAGQELGVQVAMPETGVVVERVYDDKGMAAYLTKLPIGRDGATGMFALLEANARHGKACRCDECRRRASRWGEYIQVTAVVKPRAFWAARIKSLYAYAEAKSQHHVDALVATPESEDEVRPQQTTCAAELTEESEGPVEQGRVESMPKSLPGDVPEGPTPADTTNVATRSLSRGAAPAAVGALLQGGVWVARDLFFLGHPIRGPCAANRDAQATART